MSSPLLLSIDNAKGVGPKLSQVLAKKGVETFEDALYYLPRAYEDRRHVTPIVAMDSGRELAAFGKVVKQTLIRQGRRFRFEAVLSDGTGELHLIWFHAYPSMATQFAKGKQFVVYGKVEGFRGNLQIAHPDFEPVENLVDGKLPPSAHFGRIVPIYSESEGLNQKLLRRVMAQVLTQTLPALEEVLPKSLLDKYSFPGIKESFALAHFPKETQKSETELSPAHRRLIFEEFFALQLGLSLQRKEIQKKPGFSCAEGEALVEKFIKQLPFKFTEDQKKALEIILNDIRKSVPMSRLLQGDVGCGKTVVAMAAAVAAIGSGYQAAIMAPTEILAEQHYQNAVKWLKPLGIEVAQLSGSTKGKKDIYDAVAQGKTRLVVGTQALFQDKVVFKHLGLVIVDEQHRFGVEQRAELLKKGSLQGKVPHLLMMTATPIPRTLALTVYGDLELTIIRQKPAGRSPVKTVLINDRQMPSVYTKIRQTVAKGEQVYIIYPLIEESEKLALKSAVDMHERLSREVFPELSIALLHGRMKGSEKDEVLKRFKNKEFSILVSTTVIEVGIDVPNATLMIIEHAERLGLSQLHQLRGRVGRGALQSTCVLVASGQETKRLQVMEKTEDGFVIAEEDLGFRGPGDFLGTRQSGLPGFRVGHLLRDADLLAIAKTEADEVLAQDPELSAPEHAGIRKLVEERWRAKFDRIRGG